MNRLGLGAIAGTTITFLGAWTGPVWADSIVPANDGTGTVVTPTAGTYTITGGSVSADAQNLFHSFTEFSLLTGESATFLADPAVLNILSRVTGSSPSLIDGLLQVSGSAANLYVINPNGILLGPNSALNLQGSFAAVTSDQVSFGTGTLTTVGTPDYAALVGDPTGFSFSAANPGSVVNAGTLAVSPGAAVVLLGGQVLNLGTITAPGGDVIISAVEGQNRVRITAAGSLLNLELETLPEAPGAGLLPFVPQALPELLTGSAIATATQVTVNPDGTVQLANGDPVNPNPGTTTLAGAIDVSAATQGGSILALGRDIALRGATLDAAGDLGGGTVRIGGDYQGQGPLPRAQTTLVDGGSAIAADAVTLGNGGRVIVWADGATTFQGLITARGGSNGGDGGLVETSGLQRLEFAGGRVDASAPLGNGGLWYLDPSDIIIDPTVATTIEDTLAGGTDIELSTIGGTGGNGDIILVSNINATTPNNSTLTLTASRFITALMFEQITIAGGNLVLNLNQESLANQGLPNPTIANALATIGFVTGDVTLNLGPGVYNEGETLFIERDITLNGATAASTVLDGENVGSTVVSVGTEGPITVNLNNLTITNGTQPEGDGGGGLLVGNDVTLTLTNSSVVQNSAFDSNSGGGIRNLGDLTILNSTIANNEAGVFGFGGGGISNDGILTIRNSTISGNTSVSDGGGILNQGSLNLFNSTLSGNTADFAGGGIYNEGILDITNSTISGNLSGSTGGGIFNNGSLSVTSSLVSGNTAVTDGANLFDNIGAFGSGGNNLFGSDGNAGVQGATLDPSDIVPTQPLGQILATTLATNGGPTPTLALVEGSPAIDAGSGTGADQRGVEVVNGVRDIGAFEFVPTPPDPEPEPDPDPNPDPNPEPEPNPNPDDPSECLDCNESWEEEDAFWEEDDDFLEEEEDWEEDIDWEDDLAWEDFLTAEYEDFLGVEASAFDDFDALARAATITGVPPALIYASFVPATGTVIVSDAGPQTKALADTTVAEHLVAQAEGGRSQRRASDEDMLELVLVTGNAQPRRFRTGATRGEVLQAVRQLQIELTDRTRRRLTAYLQPSQQLHGWLVAPVEEALADEGVGHISFVLDEGLRSLPLAALHDGQQFIIETYSVGLMPSLSLTDTRIGNIRNASVLAMGASEFSDQPALPAVPLELETIEQLWPGTSFLNENFTPATVLAARNDEPYPILHLATHGQFTNGALGNSYIQFWDQRLGLDQLPQLQLNDPTVELLVLSACRTVLGGEQAELGFAGLAVKSGAKTAIAALWQVSDLETAGLMAELYTYLGQTSYKAEALRQAQLAMLQGQVTVQDGSLVWSGGSMPLPPDLAALPFADTRHPYYWSAFALVGSPW